jgi:hypothetical protein
VIAVIGIASVQPWAAKALRSSACGRAAARATSAKRRLGCPAASTLPTITSKRRV